MVDIWKNLKYLALLAQVGIVVIIPIIGAFFLGNYLVNRFDLSPLITILLAIFGVIAGGYNAYQLLTKS